MKTHARRLTGQKLLVVTFLLVFVCTSLLTLFPVRHAVALDMQYPVDAVKSLQFYLAAQACKADYYNDSAVREGKLEGYVKDPIGGGGFGVGGNNTIVGQLIEADDGVLECKDLLPMAVGFWGYASPQEALSDWGYTLNTSNQRWENNGGDVGPDFQRAIQAKIYGGKAPSLSGAEQYVLYSQAFLLGCSVSGEQLYSEAPPEVQKAADSGKTNYIHIVLAKGDPAKLTDMIYSVEDAERGVPVVAKRVNESKPYDGSDGDGKLQCRTLALRASQRAGDYVAWAKTHEEYNRQIQNLQDQAANNGDGGTSDDTSCGYARNAVNWIACPVTDLMQSFANKMSEVLEGLLYFPTYDVFGKKDTSDSLHEVWQFFRNFAIALIVIAGLIMVGSEALGLGILDAYTIRKLMPRLGIAMIGIAVSWPLTQVAITLSNDTGTLVHSILTQPFRDMPISGGGPTASAANWGAILYAVVVGIPNLLTLGFFGVLSLLGTISLALIIAFVVLGLRWVIILLCVLAAPLAMAAYVLPGTQKLWGFWKTTFISTLITFPLITGLISIGEVMARITSNLEGVPGGYFLTMVVYFGPFFLLPLVFKMAGGIMSTFAGLANDKSRGIFDRGRKFRDDTRKRRESEFLAQKGTGRIGSALNKYHAMRQGIKDPGVGVSGMLHKETRAQYVNSLAEQSREEMLQKATLKATANDAAMAVAQHAYAPMSQSAKEEAYVREGLKMGLSHADGRAKTADELRAEAATEMAVLEVGLRAKVGSKALREATRKGRFGSKTGYSDTREGVEEALNDALEAVLKGDATELQVIAEMKDNRFRPEFANMDFGKTAERLRRAKAEGRKINASDVGHVLRSSVDNLNPGAIIGARKESMEILGEELNNEIQENARRASAPGATAEDVEALAASMATYSGIRDTINSHAQHLAGTFAQKLSSVELGVSVHGSGSTMTTSGTAMSVPIKKIKTDARGEPVRDTSGNIQYDAVEKNLTIRQLEDAIKQNMIAGPLGDRLLSHFLDRRREWSVSDIASAGGALPGAAAAGLAAGGASPSGGAPGGAPLAGPPGT